MCVNLFKNLGFCKNFLELTLRLLLFFVRVKVVSTFLHGPQDVFVIRVQIMIKAKKVKLGVTGLLRFQHNLKLTPLLAHKFGCPLNDVVSLDGCRLKTKNEGESYVNVVTNDF